MSDYPKLPEAGHLLFQHEETGLLQCVDSMQVQWGFAEHNPRLNEVGGLFTEMQMREYVRTDRAIRLGWLHIESAPKDGSAVLCYWTAATGVDRDISGCYGVAQWVNGFWRDPDSYDDYMVYPTHWMPLPQPPKA